MIPEITAIILAAQADGSTKMMLEKLASAVGIFYEPARIRREGIAHAETKADELRLIGQAEADVSKIKSDAELEIFEKRKRTLMRLMTEEEKHQENIEKIAAQALQIRIEDNQLALEYKKGKEQSGEQQSSDQQSQKTAEPETPPPTPDDDWLSHFVDKAKRFSDERVQILYAKVMAGEFKSPGSFSRQTIDLLSSLDPTDLQEFNRLCSCVWQLFNRPRPIIYDTVIPSKGPEDFDMDTLNNLDDLGLITFGNVMHYSITMRSPPGIPAVMPVAYQGRWRMLNLKGNSLQTGNVLFTRAGEQLYSISNPSKIESYEAKTLEKWRSMGVTIEDLPDNQHDPLNQALGCNSPKFSK